MTTSAKESQRDVYLKTPKDWHTWSLAFKAKVQSLDAAPLLEGNEKLIPYREPPNIAKKYPKYLKEGETADTIDPDEYHDRLTTEEMQRWDSTNRDYDQRAKRRMYQLSRIEKIKDWVQTHVSPDIFKQCCSPSAGLDEWWMKLQTNYKQSPEELKLDILRKYENAVKPMTKDNAEAWIARWGDVMSNIYTQDIMSHQDPDVWVHHLVRAVRDVLPNFATNNRETLSKEIKTGSLTWCEVPERLRRAIEWEVGERRGKTNHHAGFTARFNDMESGKKRGRGSEPRGKKRKHSRSRSPRPNKACRVCEIEGHHPKECWYGEGASKASDYWRPSPAVRRRAEANLKSQKELKPFGKQESSHPEKKEEEKTD